MCNLRFVCRTRRSMSQPTSDRLTRGDIITHLFGLSPLDCFAVARNDVDGFFVKNDRF
jgi:hypothetical protein